jgi:hypothetical protein
MAAPRSARLRMYNVGFGDCFLLSFTYAGGKKRHMLVDFGSMSPAKGKKVLSALEIAEDIAAECEGKLHAVVATHRHRDHISGFATNAKGTASGDVIRRLRPSIVVQPWTEAPDAPKNAKAPRLGPSETNLTLGLSAAHAVAGSLMRATAGGTTRLAKQIHIIGDDNLKNMSAIQNLATMATNEYLAAGMRPRALSRAFPGVEFTVLGPATPEEYPDIAKQRAKDAQEYWHLQATAQLKTEKARALPFAVARGETPPRLRWIMRQMDGARDQQLLGIVRALDAAMNNTSLILLLKVGTTRLLFPGDAQGESWAYVLKASKDAAEHRKELSQVDFYKVGHHGSLNATPKTLWQGFRRREARALSTALSTKSGVHGASDATKVPRTTLVAALRKDSQLNATIDARGRSVNQPWVDIPFEF